MLSQGQDAYGRLIFDHYRGIVSPEVIERDDGWCGTSAGAPAYFAPFKEWPAHQRQALRYARGRCLDVGCGAGRVALELQSRGHPVVAIDASPLAVRTCRLRGVRQARLLRLTQVDARLGRFDTVIMYGNNFGLFANRRRARWLLRRLGNVTSAGARIIAESRDPSRTTDPEHKRYHRLNRRRGRLPGQLRMRVRCGRACTPWFEYLLVSPSEMRSIVQGTSWQVARVVPSDGPPYIAVLEKAAA
jgi:SAM-dependent methyltransferase